MTLQTYHSKRDFSSTREPHGKLKRARGHSYVIQKHDATRLHYDFRLELDGVLLSWAVPKGPSLDPRDKRLAMQTEDHPVEYGDFEGTIPKGEYGGGTVMVWDRGTWEPDGDVRKAYARGRLTFTLHGKKLKGKWHLVRTHGDDSARKRWLLFKGRDDEARREGEPITALEPNSAKTARSLDEIATSADHVWHSNRSSVSHADKVLYPESGITKGEIASYLEYVGRWMLPHVAGRPLMLMRCPNGIGRCFIQKHANKTTPAGLRAIDVGHEERHLTVDGPDGLIALAQAGVLEIHTWGSHAPDVERPDLIVLDLDPDPAVEWKEVVGAARIIHERLDALGVESFVKTTGGKGLHICFAVDQAISWADAKELAHTLATTFVKDHPHRFVATMSKARRNGKIFIDYLRNGRGATFIAPYSPRARPGAPVAMPLAWAELSPKIAPDHFNVRNAYVRLDKLKVDPWAGLIRARRRAPSPVTKARR